MSDPLHVLEYGEGSLLVMIDVAESILDLFGFVCVGVSFFVCGRILL